MRVHIRGLLLVISFPGGDFEVLQASRVPPELVTPRISRVKRRYGLVHLGIDTFSNADCRSRITSCSPSSRLPIDNDELGHS